MLFGYFDLQYKRINRYLREFGVHPIVGYILVILSFIGLSVYLFDKTNYGPYVYVAMAASILVGNGKKERSDFMKSIFPFQVYLQIRLAELLLIALPFLVFLLYKMHLMESLLLLGIVGVIALMPSRTIVSRVFNTPFSYRPFEFAIGIRSSYILYFLLYFILFMAIRVDNFNLGIATLLAVFILSFTFYSKLENETYIWNYKGNSSSFLVDKMLTAAKNVSILSAPLIIILLVFWPDQYPYILGLPIIGYIYLMTFIIAKYSAYPQMMSLPQGLIFIFSLWIPPLLVFIIPYLFIQSKSSLNSILR